MSAEVVARRLPEVPAAEDRFGSARDHRAAANFRLVVESGRIVSWQIRY